MKSYITEMKIYDEANIHAATVTADEDNTAKVMLCYGCHTMESWKELAKVIASSIQQVTESES